MHRPIWRHAIWTAAACAALAAACEPDKGSARLRFDWGDIEPNFTAAPFLFLSVEERENPAQSGQLLRLEGPIAYFAGVQVAMRSVPNGDNRVAIAEFRDSRWRNSPVVYYGRSEPFRLEPDGTPEVVIRMRAGEAPTPPHPGPPPPDMARIVLRRAPWGTVDGGPRSIVTGEAGAVTAGARVFAFNAAGVRRASELADTQADADGRFAVAIDGPEAVERVYLAVADAENNLSDGGPDDGLQASLVESVEWIANLNGKIAGTDFPNPNRVVTTFDTEASLVQPFSVTTEVDQTDIEALQSTDGETVSIETRRRWTRLSLPSPPPNRVAGAMAFDPARGRIVLFGGFFRDGTGNLGDTWEWNGRTWTQVAPRGDIPLPRAGHALAYHAAMGRIVLFGGSISSRFDAGNDLWSWDGERWTQIRALGPQPPAMFDHGMAYDEARGRVVVVGGCQDFELCTPIQKNVWEFDGERWYEIVPEGPVPAPRRSMLAIYDPRLQETVVFGGAAEDDETLPDLWTWNGRRWLPRPQGDVVPTTPVAMSGGYDRSTGRVVAFGGFSTIAATETTTIGNALWAWDGATWTELPANAKRPSQRTRGHLTYDALRDEIVLFGGDSLDRDRRTWVYTGEWTDRGRVAARPTARTRHTMVYDPDRRRLVAFGGVGASDILGETWERQSSQWRKIPSGPDDPPVRFAASMVYDRDRDEIVLFGGEGISPDGQELANDTWVRRGATWSLAHPGGDDAPKPRRGAAIAFDERSGDVVLFGGTDNVTALGDTWIWNGDRQNWRQAQPPSQPPPRRFAHMAYDVGRQAIALVGGEGADGRPLDDHWEYNGSWDVVRTSVSGLGRLDGALVYDRGRRRLVLLAGGVRDAQQQVIVDFNDVFEFEDGDWNFIVPAQQRPAARTGLAAAYDEQLGTTVVFGGASPTRVQVFDDTWGWNGNGWQALDDRTVSPGPRCLHAMAYLPGQRRSVLHGGCLDGSCRPGIGDTWELDASGWRRRAFEGTPPVTFAHGLAAGPSANQLLLFGGDRTANPEFNINRIQSWRWDGNDWTVAFTTPFFLRDMRLAFDSRRNRTVIFGGFNIREGGRPAVELLEWTGNDLVRRTGGSGPPARASHAMAFDEARGVTIVHGGRDAVGFIDDQPPRQYGDTWEWDGDVWTLRTGGDGPGPRDGHVMAYDSARGRTVVGFGRGDDQVLRGDTWEWDGQQWRQLQFAGPRPSPRSDATLIFDKEQRASVLVGGGFRDTCFDDTWLLESDPGQRPAAIVTINFRASGESASTIRQIKLRVAGGGRGYTNQVPGTGEPVAGMTAEVWNAWESRWETFGVSAADAVVPTDIVFETSDAERARRLVTGDGEMHFRLTTTEGIGNGPEAARVNLDFVEATISYQLTP